MKKQIIALCLLIFCLFPQAAFAARSIIISGDKSSLFGDEQLSIVASLSGFTNGETIYIKGAFFKEGSTNYFGYTKKDESWVKNSTTAIEQRQVNIGSWDSSTIVRSDFEDSGYSGKGDYKFKLGFYYLTSGGNLSSVNWSSNILSLVLDQPVVAPTNIPTSSQITSSTSKVSVAKTATPIYTPIPTKIIYIAPKISNSIISPAKNSNSAKITQDFKISNQFAKLNKAPAEKVLGASENKFSFFPILIGIALLTGVGIWFVFKNLEQIKTWINK